MQIIKPPLSIIQIIENYYNFKLQQLFFTQYLPYGFNTNINGNWICKRQTNDIKVNNTITKVWNTNYTQYLPNEILNLIIEFSTNINCNVVCKKWTDIIKENNTITKLWHIDYTQYLPDEILDLIFEFSANLNCNYVCKRWNKIVKHNFKINCEKCNTICRKHAFKKCSFCNLYVYAMNYNILRVMSGMGGLRYSS